MKKHDHMTTLRVFSSGLDVVPAITSWYLAELGESRGKQELFTKQAPQRLKVLREHALIESAVSSNRIEGVTVDQRRIHTVVFGRAHLRDRDEEEVRGYRNALKLIHEQGAKLPVSEDTIRKLHTLARGEIGDAGHYKTKDGDIIERYPDGRTRVRFKTVPASLTPSYMAQLVSLWSDSLQERWGHPLIALAAFNLDFLCIHPFRDGNGRVSRLLMLLQLYHLGYEVGRYISIERIIEQSKDRYYETLEQSSHGWHEGKHDPWPYINYVLFTLKTAYREFEERVGQVTSPKGAKTELIISAVNAFLGEFTLSDLERACPGVSRDMIRRVLRELQKENKVECLGRGPGALWKKRGNILERG
ncbi:MAG: Fic family protein [Nitrospirota bacterium]